MIKKIIFIFLLSSSIFCQEHNIPQQKSILPKEPVIMHKKIFFLCASGSALIALMLLSYLYFNKKSKEKEQREREIEIEREKEQRERQQKEREEIERHQKEREEIERQQKEREEIERQQKEREEIERQQRESDLYKNIYAAFSHVFDEEIDNYRVEKGPDIRFGNEEDYFYPEYLLSKTIEKLNQALETSIDSKLKEYHQNQYKEFITFLEDKENDFEYAIQSTLFDYLYRGDNLQIEIGLRRFACIQYILKEFYNKKNNKNIGLLYHLTISEYYNAKTYQDNKKIKNSNNNAQCTLKHLKNNDAYAAYKKCVQPLMESPIDIVSLAKLPPLNKNNQEESNYTFCKNTFNAIEKPYHYLSLLALIYSQENTYNILRHEIRREFLYNENNEIKSHCIIIKPQDTYKEFLCINDFFTTPNNQREGYGTKMLSQIKARHKKKPLPIIAIINQKKLENQNPLVNFYFKNGFRALKEDEINDFNIQYHKKYQNLMIWEQTKQDKNLNIE